METDASQPSSYRQHVEKIRRGKPSLTNLCDFLSRPASTFRPCLATCLDFMEDVDIPSIHELDRRDLVGVLREPPTRRPTIDSVAGSGVAIGALPDPKNLQGRIVIIEDLDRHTIETLGTHLDIDPVFFAAHIYQPWRSLHAQTPDQSILPSQMKRQCFTNIQFHRAVLFDERPPAKKILREMNIDRKVVVLPTTKDRHIGFVQSCTSVMFFQLHTHWLSVVLVDRPISDDYRYNLERGGIMRPVNLRTELFLGGYEDFLDSPGLGQFQQAEGPGRRSPLEDLVFYWSAQCPQRFTAHNANLDAIADYPLRIIAAEWIKYIAVMYDAIKLYEYSTSVDNIRQELDKLNTDMRSLQRWRRRSMSSMYKIKAVSRFLERETLSEVDTTSLKKDYEYIAGLLGDFGSRLEGMLPVVTSLVQIVDSRRSLEETANVSRLTVMALIFVPLTYVSSLFSMSDQLGPGGPLFWIYFVVAVPTTVAVFLVAKPPYGVLNTRQFLGSCWRSNKTRNETIRDASRDDKRNRPEV